MTEQAIDYIVENFNPEMIHLFGDFQTMAAEFFLKEEINNLLYES